MSSILEKLIKPIDDAFAHLSRKVRKINENFEKKVGNTEELKTTNKGSLVDAINEVADNRILIDDEATGVNLWTSTKVNAEINRAITDLIDGAGEDSNTLREIAEKIQTLVQADAGLVSVTAEQNFTVDQQAQARANIGLGKLATKDKIIDDELTGTDTTWSSKKITDEVAKVVTGFDFTKKDFIATIDAVFAGEEPVVVPPVASDTVVPSSDAVTPSSVSVSDSVPSETPASVSSEEAGSGVVRTEEVSGATELPEETTVTEDSPV